MCTDAGSAGSSVPPPPPRRRRYLASGTAVLAVVGLVGLALWTGGRVRSPEQVAADAAAPPASPITVAVEERVLTEPVVLRGKVMPGASVKVHPPAAALGPDSVVTSVRIKTGDTLREGQVVFVRSGIPVVGLVLPFPLYRDLAVGMDGPDVTEIQKALRRLGYGGGAGGRFDAATQQAWQRLLAARGFPPPSTPAAPALPRSSVLVLAHASASVTAVQVAVGDVLQSADPVLFELDGQPPYVAAAVGPDQAALITAGVTASVYDDVTGRAVPAVVDSVGVESATDAGTGGVAVRLRFTGTALPVTADRTVRVDLSPGTDAARVMAVPILAVYSRPDATVFVSLVRTDGSTVDVDVRAGRAAGGWVQIEAVPPATLRPGDLVLVGGPR